MVCDTQGQLPHELTNAVWQQVQWLIPHSDDYYMGGHAALHGLANAMVNCQNSGHSCLPQAATLLNTDSHDQHQAAEVLVPQLKLKDLLSYGAGELHEAAMFVRECLEVRYSHEYIIVMS